MSDSKDDELALEAAMGTLRERFGCVVILASKHDERTNTTDRVVNGFGDHWARYGLLKSYCLRLEAHEYQRPPLASHDDNE